MGGAPIDAPPRQPIVVAGIDVGEDCEQAGLSQRDRVWGCRTEEDTSGDGWTLPVIWWQSLVS